MNGHTCITFYVVSLTVLSISAADVFIINAKPSKRSPVSVSIDRSLQTLQKLLGKKINEEDSLRVQLLSGNVQKTGKEIKPFVLRPVLSSDLTKTNVADLLRLVNSNKNVKKTTFRTPPEQYRLFHNMYGVPKKLNVYGFKKPTRPFGLESSERLQPLIKLLLSNMVPKIKHTFTDLTRFDPSNLTEDYIDIGEMSRNNHNRYSRDYIDLDRLKFRRNGPYPFKAALRTFSVESNDASSEANKLKRFEIIKNKQNKKDIKSTESDEVEYKKKKKATFKKKSNKKKDIPMEDAGTSLSSDISGSEERIKQKSKKKLYQPTKKKQKFVSQENDEWHDNEEVGLYLQGNKLTMYPPMEPDSSDENNSDDARRRGDRLPYFLPKRYHWNMDDIHSLGYFFFNGPKGISLERESRSDR